MRTISSSSLAILPTLLLYLGLVSCAGESDAGTEGTTESGLVEEAGEHAAPVAGVEGQRAEGSVEHQEGRAAREGGEHGEGGESGEGGEHAEGGEHDGGAAHSEEGEESGVYIGAAETWDVVRNGARLVLSYDSQAHAFVGSVENTTAIRLCAVRVEVHLATGTELGPTDRKDLDPGQTMEVRLATAGEAFESWTAHPELSPCGGV